MKLALISIASFFLITETQDETKRDMLCKKWLQVGIKIFGQDYKSLDRSMAEVLALKKDGSFEKEVYGQLRLKGVWKFNIDSSKLAFSMTEMNGTTIKDMPLNDINPTDSIIKLTSDTVIIGSLGYYGKQRLYGHDDRYYIREKHS